MKRRKIVVLNQVLTITVLTSGCSWQERPWIPFRSSEHGFIALFPTEPTRKDQTVNTESGPITNHVYTARHGQTVYTFAVADLPGEVEVVDQKAVFDDARDGAVANTQGTLLSELIIEVEGNSGREIEISVAEQVTCIARVFLVGDHLYQAMSSLLVTMSIGQGSAVS
ncbi:MAG TPA: hypothetical protein PLP42_05875 [Acidobacteriota bacterium]|nr:hypothetical protein [Acidobacteriota bacterium]